MEGELLFDYLNMIFCETELEYVFWHFDVLL